MKRLTLTLLMSAAVLGMDARANRWVYRLPSFLMW